MGSPVPLLQPRGSALRRLAPMLGVVVLLAGAAAPILAGEVGRPAISARDLVAMAFFNMYAEDYIQTIKMVTQPRGGIGVTKRLQVIRKRSVEPGRALVRFLEPPELRRTSILIIENETTADDLFVYLPAVRMTRHLSASQRGDSFFGTDLSYEDVEPKRVDDFVLSDQSPEDGRADLGSCRIVNLIPKPEYPSSYERMESCIDPRLGQIVWTNFFQHGAIAKRLEVDLGNVKKLGKRNVPFSMTMFDRRRGSSTHVLTESYDSVTEIPDELFSTWNLEVGNARRDVRKAMRD